MVEAGDINVCADIPRDEVCLGGVNCKELSIEAFEKDIFFRPCGDSDIPTVKLSKTVLMFPCGLKAPGGRSEEVRDEGVDNVEEPG